MDEIPEESTTHWQYFGRDGSSTGDMRAFSAPRSRRKPGEVKVRIKRAIDSVLGPESAGSSA
ncbi:MAG: hypothetical protein M3O65_10520 [Actinomycetota bacterium]|nr:hypothetical protein [Actinomycetota bacterium]